MQRSKGTAFPESKGTLSQKEQGGEVNCQLCPSVDSQLQGASSLAFSTHPLYPQSWGLEPATAVHLGTLSTSLLPILTITAHSGLSDTLSKMAADPPAQSSWSPPATSSVSSLFQRALLNSHQHSTCLHCCIFYRCYHQVRSIFANTTQHIPGRVAGIPSLFLPACLHTCPLLCILAFKI